MYYISQHTNRLKLLMLHLFWICLIGRKSVSAFSLNGQGDENSSQEFLHSGVLADINPASSAGRKSHLTPVYPMLDQTLSFLAYAAFAVYIVMLFSGIVTRQTSLFNASSVLRRQGLAAVDGIGSNNQPYAGAQANLVPSYLQLMMAQLQDISHDNKLVSDHNSYESEGTQSGIAGVGFPTMNRYLEMINKQNGETNPSKHPTDQVEDHIPSSLNSNIFMQHMTNQMYKQALSNPNDNKVLRQTTVLPTSWISNNARLTDFTHHRFGKLEAEASDTVTASSVTFQSPITTHSSSISISDMFDVLDITEAHKDNFATSSSQYTPISHILRMNDSISHKWYTDSGGDGNITEYVNGDISITPIHVKGDNKRRYKSKLSENIDINISEKTEI